MCLGKDHLVKHPHFTLEEMRVLDVSSSHPLHIRSSQTPEYQKHSVMSDLEDDELLLQVAGRSKPSARPNGKKRKRGSISISEDDDDDDDDYSAEQEDGEMEDEPQIEAASRGKSSAEKSRQMQASEKDSGVRTSCNRAHYLQQSDKSASSLNRIACDMDVLWPSSHLVNQDLAAGPIRR